MQNICDQKPKVRYLVALDDSKVKLKQITKAVGKHLGTGKIKPVLKEDALLNKEISVNIFFFIRDFYDHVLVVRFFFELPNPIIL